MAKKRVKKRSSVQPVAHTSIAPFAILFVILTVAGVAGLVREMRRSNQTDTMAASRPLTPPPGAAHVTEPGIPPGMSKEEAMNMWERRADEAMRACPHTFVSHDVLNALIRHDLGILFGTEALEGFFAGVMASVRLHSFRGAPAIPTLKIQTSILNLNYVPPQMNSTLVHECAGHLREVWFRQRPAEFFDDEQELHNDWKAYNMVETELYAYWVESEFCASNPGACPSINAPVKAYLSGGLEGMVHFMETNYEFVPPWTNDFCPAAEQAFTEFRRRHIALVSD